MLIVTIMLAPRGIAGMLEDARRMEPARPLIAARRLLSRANGRVRV
jgi:hypothetical protein